MSYAYTSAFAPITQALHGRLRQLPRVCDDLYQWLRRMAPPGVELEINLKEFAEEQNRSIQWVKACFTQLVEAGLLEQLKRWWGYQFRVKVIDPDYHGSALSKKNVSAPGQTCDRSEKTFKPEGSTPQSAVPSYKEKQGLTNPAAVEFEEIAASEPAIGEAPSSSILPIGEYEGTEADPAPPGLETENCAVFGEVEALVAPAAVPPNLRELIAQTPADRVKQAVGYVQERLRAGGIHSIVGYLYDAIVGCREGTWSLMQPRVHAAAQGAAYHSSQWQQDLAAQLRQQYAAWEIHPR